MNLTRIIEIKDLQQDQVNTLIKGVKNVWAEYDILVDFVSKLGLKNTEEMRFFAYNKLVNFKWEPLSEYLEKNNIANKIEIEDAAYTLTQEYHFAIYESFLKQIEDENLASEFYLEVLKQTHQVWASFCSFHLVWNHHILNVINPSLEKKLWDNTENIISYLRKNSLLDLGHFNEEADRSYSVLVQTWDSYERKAYVDAFPKEIGAIIDWLSDFIEALQKLEDPDYNRKQEYIDYLQSIINAFSETNCDQLVAKWATVDEKWMAVDTPFQIVHPIEYYEDKYRKAVSPEWDIRIDDTVTMKSHALHDIDNMYEHFFDTFWRDRYKPSYEFSLDTLKRTSLHICSTVMSYGSRMTGMYSAQVIPNDPIITEKCGKKIFAVPSFILTAQKNNPVMKLTHDFFDKKVLENYRDFLYGPAENYYKIYDIETIGHEFGHTLWLDTDTETTMNKKSGAYKDIEEFKATSGWLVSFFLNEQPELVEDILTTHIMRCIWMMKYRKVDDVVPYYAECLIHLDTLYNSGVITFDNSKLSINYSSSVYEKYKKLYITTYQKLIDWYLNKRDAWEFLWDYAIFEGKYYNAKNTELKAILDHYYSQYEKMWNEIHLENISEI